MATSANYGFNLTADGIVKQALQISGLLPLGGRPQPTQAADAREILDVMLKGIQAKGVVLTCAERTTLALTSGTASYALPADTLDVEFPTTITASGGTNDTIVEKMVYGDYALISDKASAGMPTRVYVEKQASLTAIFWPVPSASFTWNYRRVRTMRDMDAGNVNMDLTVRWLEAVVWKMAHRLSMASSLSASARAEIRAEAGNAEAVAMGQENERGDLNFGLTGPYG